MKIKIVICLILEGEVGIGNQRVVAQRKVCHQEEGNLEAKKLKPRKNHHNIKLLNMSHPLRKKQPKVLASGDAAKEQKVKLQTT